jgi:hypothetical protein
MFPTFSGVTGPIKTTYANRRWRKVAFRAGDAAGIPIYSNRPKITRRYVRSSVLARIVKLQR